MVLTYGWMHFLCCQLSTAQQGPTAQHRPKSKAPQHTRLHAGHAQSLHAELTIITHRQHACDSQAANHTRLWPNKTVRNPPKSRQQAQQTAQMQNANRQMPTCVWPMAVCAAMHIKQHSLHKQHQHVAQCDEHQVQWIVSHQACQSLLALLAVGQQVDQAGCKEHTA